MKDIRIAKGAKVLVDLAEVKKGESVLVLADYNTFSVGNRIVSAVYQVDAYPIFMILPPLKFEGESLPEVITEMAKHVNVIIAPMTCGIAHTPTRYETEKSGVRLLVFSDATEEKLTLEAFDADFHALRPRVEKYGDLLTKAKKARVTSPKGTDITMSLEGRPGRAMHGFSKKGDISAGPSLESSIAPVEGTAEGKIVVDTSIIGLGLVKDLVTITVHKGFATKIEGGVTAEKFREILENYKDPNIYNIGELGIGMNPKCTTPEGGTMDEAIQGMIHIALGTSVRPGGKVKAAGHWDNLVSKATLELDGVVVLKDGELVF